ncbi:probable protein phosphatase 2C 42 [Neltuma alba]|uniref:probable protein phosphatase 2C 42 n=1 Tax=Neltuma alba TaxID=207710 RepID=UPI0010A326B8|nr:probable protein phosphatase 2C 42 [Prosopis alba]
MRPFSCFKGLLGGSGGDDAGEGTSRGGGAGGGKEGMDGSVWFRDNGKHGCGDFSMAVVQANRIIEDQSQLESGPLGTFVGIYDGHGGYDAARYVCDHLFQNLQAESQGSVTRGTIEGAIRRTEEGFSRLVAESWNAQPALATTGTCCLIGVIFRQTLFVANLGDSRVVLGSKLGGGSDLLAIPLSHEHNVNVEEVRRELRDLHPNDPQVVQMRRGAFRVKGIVQVCRAIGDLYMKDAQFNREAIAPKFRLPEPMDMPYLTANPEIMIHPLHANDSFLIFASDGLWEFLDNNTAVGIVKSGPRGGSAKRLIKAALTEAGRRKTMKLIDLEKVPRAERREYHDDISVIVVFINHNLVSRGALSDPPVSVRCPPTLH